MGNDSTNMMLFTLKLLKGDFVWELFYGDCILILSMLMRGVLVAESIVVNKRLYSLFGFLLTSIRIMIFFFAQEPSQFGKKQAHVFQSFVS